MRLKRNYFYLSSVILCLKNSYLYNVNVFHHKLTVLYLY